MLIEYGGGVERRISWANPPDELLDLVVSESHLVAVLPQELAGSLSDELDLERLGGSLIVEVAERSPAVEPVRAMRRNA